MHAGAERLTFRSCFHIIEISKFVLNIHRPIVHISHVTVQRRMHMTADTWFVIHLFGVFITFVLLVIVVSKDDPSYKSELSLTIACCLVALVAKSIYIAGGSEEMLVAVGKMEYLGKSFANYCALLFPDTLEESAYSTFCDTCDPCGQCLLLYYDCNRGLPPFVL